MDLSERISNAIAKRAGLDSSTLSQRTPVSELPIDSLAFMDLIMQLEDAEDVTLNDAEIETVLSATTLSEIVSVFAAAKTSIVHKQET